MKYLFSRIGILQTVSVITVPKARRLALVAFLINGAWIITGGDAPNYLY